MKTHTGLLFTSLKTVAGLALASVKTVDGLTVAVAGASFTDTFDRADADPMTNPVSGGTWTSGPGGWSACKISGNALEGSVLSAYDGARVLTPAFAANHRATVTLVTVNSFVGPCVRMQSSSSASCYCLMTAGAPAILRLYKVTESGSDLVAGDFFQLGADIALVPDLVAGNTISLGAVGTTLNVYANGSFVTSRSDATWSGGQPGIFVYGNLATVNSFTAIDA